MMNRKTSLLSVIGGTALSLVLAAQADDFWKEKDYRQWSEKDCRKLLAKSPWSKQHTLTQIHITPLGASPTLRGREDNPRIIYQVQFRSASPVRQAMVRLQQIQVDYDKLAAEQKQTFDKQAEDFLAREFPDAVVVYVAYSSNVQWDDRELARYWQNQTTETLKNSVFLIGTEGTKATLLDYRAVPGSGRGFQFVFPRRINGTPLAGPKDKSVKLEFEHPEIRGERSSRVLVEFKVKDMLLDGELIY